MINQPESETIDSSRTPPSKDVLSYSVSQNPVASELDGDSIDSSIQNALTETASNQSKKTPISIPVQELTPIEKAVNEYAKINNARNKTALNQSLVSASAKDPDTAAKSQALATNLNVSTGVVDFDIELAKRQMLLRKAEAMKLAEKYPSLARSFLNQDFAEVAHDDIDNLAKTSDISRRLIATEKSPSDSLPLEFDPIRTANYYATNTLEGFKSDWERGYKSGDITDRSSKLGYSAFTSPGSELRDAYIFQAENLKSKTEEYLGTWTESLAELAGQMAPMTVEAIATGVVASGGTALAASIFPPAELPLVPGAFAAGFAGSMSYQSYEIETGASYLDLRKGDEDYEPMSHEEAAAIAPTVGLINAVLETASNLFFFIPGAKLANYALKKTVKETVSKSLRKATVGKLARSAAVRVLKTGTLETVTEVLQTIVPKIVQEANVPEGRMSAFDTEEGRKRFADEIAVTIEKTFKGAFLLGLIPGGAKFIHERSILNESIEQQNDITNHIDNAKESKVNKRSKTTYASYLAEQLSGESLHIGVEQFEQARRKNGVGLQEVEKIIPGITKQVADAKASSSDIVIPTSLYLSELIDTEFGVSIRNDIRADAEGMSINEIAESQEFLKELKSINKQAIEDFKKTNKDWAESAGKIEEEVFAKIKAAGNYTEEEARMLAQWHRDTAVVLASRFEMTPEQFNAKFGLSIESAYTPEQQAPAQGSFEQAVAQETLAVLTNKELNELSDYAYGVGAIQSDLDAIETEIDRRFVEIDVTEAIPEQPIKLEDLSYNTSEETSGVGIEELMRQSAAQGRLDKLTPKQLGESIRRNGDIAVMSGLSQNNSKNLENFSDEELGTEAYAALNAHENRLKMMKNRLRARAAQQGSFEQASRADLGLGQQAAPAPDIGVFDANNPPVSSEAIFALMDADGKIYYDINATMHGDLVETFPDITDTVIDGGFIVNGKYMMGKSDGGYSAFEGEQKQIDAVRNFTEQANTGEFSATDPNMLRQAAVRQTPMPSVTTINPISPIGLAIASIPASGVESIKDSNTFFKKVWKKLLIATGKQIRSKSDESVKAVAKMAVADMQGFVGDNPQFANYYSQDWIKTRVLLDDYAGRPITNDEFLMFRVIDGLTSPNTMLPSNISDTVKMWTHWMNKGSFDEFLLGPKPITGTSVVFESAESISGTTANVKVRTVKIVANLVKELGSVKAAIDYLREPVTVKELHAVNKTLGYAGNVSNIGNIRALVQMATGQDTLIPRMFIFGQKVGAYTLNSIGDERFTTVDIWESRYIRSFFSGMFENEIGLPVDEKEHNTFVRFGYAFKDEMERVTGKTWTPSSLQALRWFYIIAATRAAGYSKASTSETISTYTNRVLQSTFDYDQPRETNATNSTTTPPRRIEPKKYERNIDRDLDAKGITDPKQRREYTQQSWIRFARSNRVVDEVGFQFDTDRSGVPRRSGTLSGLATVATHTPGVRLVDALAKAGVSTQPYVELEPTAEGVKTFSDLVRKVNANSKFGTAVYVYSDADYAKKRLFISESGKSGFALSSDGDIVSVFSESGSREGRGAMILATQMGGTKLDCFDTILPGYYAAHGFRAVARVPWNDEFIPAGWDFDAFGQYNGGRPDVVYMVYEEKYSKPYSNTDGVVVSNPDEAVAIQTKDIKTEADRAATSKARYAQLVRPPSTEFAQSAQNKPARGFFNPKQLKMMLGSKSDFTTFIHELAHYNLTVLGRIASDPQSPSQIREDMDTTLSWFGIAGENPEQRLANWNAMTLEEQRRHHETFAYNHEIYLSEGKSPSIEMQGVFERFSQFVKRIYISIRDDLNAIYKQEFGTDLPMMTGEIRRVMDRMIATDEQIRSAEERRNMEDTFRDQELSGMDDAQWASYQQMRAEATQKSVSELNEQSLAATTWASRLKAKKVKELEAEQEELRSEIRKQVKKEVESRNVYRAIKFLKYGILQTAGGEEVEFTGSNKLNTNAVKLMVPKENMDKFGSGKNGMVALDGYHPDIVSEMFNYSSGDELILAILDAKPMDEVIDGITEDRMEIENGELNSPQAIEAAADKAVHNEARVKLVAVELRWLTKATQPVRAMIAAAKSVAKQMLETKRLRDIKPGDYASAAARAAKESQTAYFASQSAETAAKTAYTRHYNKMIAEGVEETKAVEMATKVSDEARAKAESRSEAHKKKYGKMKPSEVAAQAKRSQLLQEQLALEANDAIDQVKKSLKYLRNVLSDKNVQKIGADNSDQIALLLERFELKNISLKEMDKRTSLANWIASQLELGLEVDISKELIEQTNKIPYRNLTLSEFNDLVDAVKTIEYMGKNENAVLTAAKKAAFKETKDEIVKSIIENAGDRKASTRTPKSGTIGGVTNQVTRFIAAHLKAASVVRILDGGKDDGPLWNYLIRPANKSGDKETSMKATATEAASKILNPFFKSGRMGGKGKFFVSVNESLNREEKLVIALNMGNEGNIQRMLDGYGWTLEQVIPILESMTAEELNAVQEIWDLFGTYKSEISAMSRKIYGKDLDFIEPTPIQIKSASGETVSLRGGYYPAKYDPMASLAAENYEDAEKGKDLLRAAHISATTSRAYSKQRAEKVVDRPLIRNLSALYSGLNEVIHDLSWREWTIDANKLMRDKAFDKEIRERYGPAFKNQLKSWIKDVAAGEKGMDTDVDIALNFLRQGVSSAGLGFNLTSAALQITGFNQSIIRVGPKYIGYGIMQVMKRGIGAFREVNELSEFMANRSRTQFRELNELRNRVQGQSAAMKRVRMGTYFLMMKMQRSVDVPTWIGAYAKQLEINPDEQLARDIADQTVIDTQGSGMVKDLSGVERGGAGAKLFTVFYGYMNTVYNMAAVETMTEKKRGKLAAKYVMLFVVPVVLSYALKQLLKPSKDDDDEFDLEQMAKDLSIEQIEYLMGTMVVAREFSQIARTMIDPSAPSMGYSGPAGLRTIKDTYTAATQFGQGEFDSAFRKSAINLIGDISGLPSAQVNRTIDGIEALMEDETTDIRAPLFGVRK